MKQLFNKLTNEYDKSIVTKKDYKMFLIVWIIFLAVISTIKIFREYYTIEGSELYNFLKIDVPNYFPFSIFSLTFNSTILVLAIPILLLILYSLKTRMNPSKAIFIGILFSLGLNFVNGGIENGFINTLTYGDVTYYYEALKIENWVSWLAEFNSNHLSMLNHSASHPPGPTLIIYFLSDIYSVIPATITYTIFSFSNLILFYFCLKQFDLSKVNISWLVLLYSVIPSFNIYSILCVDSAFLVFFNIFLLGLIKYQKGQNKKGGAILILIGLVLVGFFTFAVTYLFAVLGLFAIYNYKLKKENTSFRMVRISIAVFFLVYYFIWQFWGFNWLDAFLTASKSENPNGFMLLNHPLNYIFTRLEGFWEWLVFAGLPVSIYLIKIPFKKFYKEYPFSIIAIITIVLMLLSGAFRTGETGRVLMFTYPYLLLALKDLEIKKLKYLFLICISQSIIMQIFGFWIW
ncbi:hypothetical protein OAQ99_05785 [Candidatus Kapabacteria bacterium]|nr:hypothetical protein [Candidatus Kapabacteria bacterium]